MSTLLCQPVRLLRAVLEPSRGLGEVDANQTPRFELCPRQKSQYSNEYRSSGISQAFALHPLPRAIPAFLAMVLILSTLVPKSLAISS